MEPCFPKLLVLFIHSGLEGFFLAQSLFRHVFPDILGDLRTAVRVVHRAEVGGLRVVLWKDLIVELSRGFGVEAEVELVLPAELEAVLAEGFVAVLGTGVAFGEVGGF